MPTSVVRPPVNPAYKVRPYYVREKSKKVFEAKWGNEQTAPSSPVSIIAAASSGVRIDSKFARIEIYQIVDKQKYDVCSFQVPLVGNKVSHLWTAEPVKTGNFEEGVYHFYISAGLYWGETEIPLLIRDITKRNADGWVQVKNNPNMTNLKGY